MNQDPFGPWTPPRRRLWIVTSLIVCILAAPGFLRSLRPARDVGIDFFQEWSSALNAINGLPIYGDHVEAAERYLGFEVEPDEETLLAGNTHPPTSVLLAMPFTYLDYPDAALAWNLASIVALGLSVWLLVRQLDLVFSPWSLLPMTALILVCNPFRQHVNQGQINFFLLLLIMSAWTADRTSHPWRAGLLLGIATSIKLFPGFLFLYFAARRQWTVVMAGIVGMVSILGVTVWILGWQSYATYVTEVMPLFYPRFGSTWLNASVPGIWNKLFDGGADVQARHLTLLTHSHLIARTGALVSCAVILALWVRAVWKAETRLERDLAFALTITTMFLVAPVTWEHYLLIPLLPLTLAWLTLPRSRPATIALLLIVAAFWINPVLWWNLFIPGTSGVRRGVATPLHTITVLSVQCYALILLYALGLRSLDSATSASRRTQQKDARAS